MPFEIISGIVGATVAELISKLAPPRKTQEFSGVPFESLHRRNKWHYRGLNLVSGIGALAPFFLVPLILAGTAPEKRGVWSAMCALGAIFGLPFFAALAYASLVWWRLGDKRLRELIFYFETKQATNVYVFYAVAFPLSIVGIISLVALFILVRT